MRRLFFYVIPTLAAFYRILGMYLSIKETVLFGLTLAKMNNYKINLRTICSVMKA